MIGVLTVLSLNFPFCAFDIFLRNQLAPRSIYTFWGRCEPSHHPDGSRSSSRSTYHHRRLSTQLFHEWIGQLDAGGIFVDVEGLAPRFFVWLSMPAANRIVFEGQHRLPFQKLYCRRLARSCRILFRVVTNSVQIVQQAIACVGDGSSSGSGGISSNDRLASKSLSRDGSATGSGLIGISSLGILASNPLIRVVAATMGAVIGGLAEDGILAAWL